MRKLIVLLLSVFLFACSMNVSSFDEQVKPEKVEGAIKVAVLPLEKLDNQSGYIKKIMEVRDLQLLFDLSEKFILMDIESTNKVLEDFGDIAVDELDKEEILEIGQELGADVVITATIEELRNPQFNFIFNLFSMRTGDVAAGKIVVVKNKEDRLNALNESFMGKIDEFVTTEMLKLIDIAKQNYNIKRYDIAQESFENIQRIDPSLKDTYYYLGLINLNQERYDEALGYFNYLVEQDSTGNIDYLEKQAQVFLRQKMYREATVPMRKIVEIRDTKDDWLLLSDLYARINDLNNMRDAVAKAIAKDPENEDAIYRYANVLYDMQNYQEAIPYLEQAVEYFPEDDIIVSNLVSAYQQTGQIAQAIANYEAIVNKDSKNINARLNLANMYLSAAKDAEKAGQTKTADKYKQNATKAYNAVVKIDNTNGVVYTRLANLYLENKDYAQATTNVEKAMVFSPNNYAPFLLSAQIKQSLGIEKFQAAVKLNAEIPKATGSKAETLANQRDQAKEDAGRLYRQSEENLNQALKVTDQPKVINIVEARLARLREFTERLESF
ncbi:MAG: tetratricopeptide repeat protein [Candidatus Cloacimonadales bacterium]